MGRLLLVPTPIGNLEDITLRALRSLREAVLIAAEDTRTSRVLTTHYGISTPLTSYHEHNKLAKLDEVLAALARGDVALISDAGTPGISDPGHELIMAALQRGIEVLPLPGACAVTTALVGSGLASDSFLFIGFLPRKAGALRELLRSLQAQTATTIAFESPHRLAKSLALLREVMGAQRRVCVAREMSKKYEQFVRGSADEVYQQFAHENPRGEVTLVIAGAEPEDAQWTEGDVRVALQRQLDQGQSLAQAARSIAKTAGWKKSAVYKLGIPAD